MNSLALVRAHARIGYLDLARWPGYVVPTIVFPAMFFALFDLPFARRSAGLANFTTLAFVVFSIVGVTLYQFGVGIAQERGRPWERYLRTLPASAGVRFAARILTAVLFGMLTALVVVIVSRAFTPIDLNAGQWLRVAVYAFLGGVPFVLIGISIGYWTSARAAVPIATAANLLLAYAGGTLDAARRAPRFRPTNFAVSADPAVRRSLVERRRLRPRAARARRFGALYRDLCRYRDDRLSARRAEALCVGHRLRKPVGRAQPFLERANRVEFGRLVRAADDAIGNAELANRREQPSLRS